MCCLQSTLKCVVPCRSQTLLTVVILWTVVSHGVFSFSASDDKQQRRSVFLFNDNDQLPVCPNHRLPEYVTIKTLPILLRNVSGFSWSQNSVLSHLISCFELELMGRESERVHTRLCAGSLPILVDIVFIIEQPENIVVESKWKSFLKSVETLSSLAENNKRTNVRFYVVTYSVLENNVHQTLTFNQRIQFAELEKLLSNLMGNSTVQQSVDKVYHVSLKRNLALITDVLKNDSSIKLRPNSELYIISLLDMHTSIVDQSSKSSDETILEIASLVRQATSDKSSPRFLQFVFDARNQIASSFLGDPSLSSLYEDCSHFNKASTLSALLENHSGNTLQAHLLSNGIMSRTLTWKDLEQPECAHGLIPTISGHFPIYPIFKNNCRTGLDCPNCFCSPIHGWVNTDLIDRSNKILDDRIPMSVTFSASHEDLARATHDHITSTTEVPEEKLTIYSETRYHSKATPSIIGTPKILQWNPNHDITQDIIGRKQPVVLKNTVVHSWPAMKKWNFSYISNNFGLETLESVKCTNTYLTFDPDGRVPLKLNVSIPFITRNMKRDDFFSCVVGSGNPQVPNCPDEFLGHYYFGSVPAKLKKDLLPNQFLYNTDKDFEANRQFIWISSSGMITHTHFDQDYNLFVQLVGKKRFTLWSSFQHELMYTYPRIHPLWHKSQVNYKDVDTHTFPAFIKAKAVQIELSPGDMLYVPPYTWHYVETLSPSVSLSTWSHDYNVYDHMNAIYRHDHKFDLIENPQGQMFVLRLYLDMMIHHLYGVKETTNFFVKLVQTRFSSLTNLFPPHKDDPLICEASVPNKIPTCVHVHGDAKLDMIVIGNHFAALELEVRDVLFMVMWKRLLHK